MAAKLAEGDTIATQGEVTMVHDDGTVTVWPHGYGVPITTGGEYLSLVVKKTGPRRKGPLRDARFRCNP